MTQDDYNDLKAQVEAYAQQDVHLGRVLTAMLAHLGDLAGVETSPAPVVEEAAPVEAAPAGRRRI